MNLYDPTPVGGARPNDDAPEATDRAGRLMTAGQTARPAPSFPFTLGHYLVVEKIGEGGMGAVYKALHGRLKKAVALKILPHGRDSDVHSLARFEREMEAIGRLNHDNIVRATDAGEADGIPYLVMELIDGLDLARLVRVVDPLPVAAACELVRQAAVGLQYVHENGLVHRDVKPSNLLLSVEGRLKITDLGLALLSRNERATGELTLTGQVMGTADYMAPEQWEDSHAVDIRADLYSLGCTLYTLLAGRPPFSGPKHRSALRKMAAHAKELVAPITDHRADVPSVVEELRRRLMAKEPADRPAEPAEVARTLEPYCTGADLAALAREAMARPRPADAPVLLDHTTETRGAAVVAATPAGGQTVTAPPVPRPRPRRSLRAAGGVGALLLLAGLAAGPWLRPWAPARPPADPQPPPSAPTPTAPGDWRNLLAERPTATFWIPSLTSRWDYDAKKELLWVQNGRVSLIRLGKTDATSYRLQIGLRQPRWTGHVGVYFGGRPGPEAGAFRYQLIELSRSDVNNIRNLCLVRSVGAIHPGFWADRGVSKRSFAKWPLPEPPGNAEYLLEITVKDGELKSAFWNGFLCSDLTTDEAEAAVQGEDGAGEFGIYGDGDPVIVSIARFQETN